MGKCGALPGSKSAVALQLIRRQRRRQRMHNFSAAGLDFAIRIYIFLLYLSIAWPPFLFLFFSLFLSSSFFHHSFLTILSIDSLQAQISSSPNSSPTFPFSSQSIGFFSLSLPCLLLKLSYFLSFLLPFLLALYALFSSLLFLPFPFLDIK